MRVLMIGPTGQNHPLVKMKKILEEKGHITKLINDATDMPKYLYPYEFVDCIDLKKPIPLSRIFWREMPDANLVIIEEGRPIIENDLGELIFDNDLEIIPVVYIDRECVHGSSVINPTYMIYRSDLSKDLLKLSNEWYYNKNIQNIYKSYPCIDPDEFKPAEKVRDFVCIDIDVVLKFRPQNWIAAQSYKYIKRWYAIIKEIDWWQKSCKENNQVWFPAPISFEKYKELVATSRAEIIFVNPLEPISRRIFEAGLSHTLPILYVHEDDNTSIPDLNSAGFIDEKNCLIVKGITELYFAMEYIDKDKFWIMLQELELLILSEFTYKKFVTWLLAIAK